MNFSDAVKAYAEGKKVRCSTWVDCLYIQIDDWAVNEITPVDATLRWELFEENKAETKRMKDLQLIEKIRFLIKEWEKG